jgi:adenylosuccinate synthase
MQINSIAVLGLQWGDEGKGKIIDYLSRSSDAVVRFGGGSNAGHTIVADGQKFILRLLPSGILHPDKQCFIGPGVACDPEVLNGEIEALSSRGISTSGRLHVDYATHLVLPLHKAKDSLEETSRGKGALDTTKRGIGPSYADRVSRCGIRIADIFDNKLLSSKIANLVSVHNDCYDKSDNLQTEIKALKDYVNKYEPLFKSLVADVAPRLIDMISSGKIVLFEGAQGSLLDVDYGTYPYTTSSHTTIGGIFTGLGIPPAYLGQVIGVIKAYITRVGHGAFPTELNDDKGALIRERGAEFGSVTGRPRRTGWLDLAALKRMIAVNGVTRLAVTKLDVLDGIKDIFVCEAYEVDGKRAEVVPPNHPDFSRARPIYTRLDGWSVPLSGKTKLAELPSEARAYLDFISIKTGVPIWLISTGFKREDTIINE